MPRLRRSNDFPLSEYLLCVGRVALVCCLLLNPFRSFENSADEAGYQHELPAQLVWWASGGEFLTSWYGFRDDINGSVPAEPDSTAARKSLPRAGYAETNSVICHLHPSLVELGVRIQV